MDPAPNSLYVFFHGTISLVEYEDCFRAIFIGMDEHRVAAGNFLTERTIKRGDTLTISGIDPQVSTASLDREKNIVVDVERIDKAALERFAYTELILPKPYSTRSFRTGQWNREFLKGDSLGRIQSGNFSAVQMFEYRVQALPSVTLEGTAFRLWRAGVPDFQDAVPERLTSSLHLINEPETAPFDLNHLTDEFNRSCLVLGADLRLQKPLPFPDRQGDLPLGVLDEETLNIELRQKPVINRLAQIITQKSFRASGDHHFCGPVHGRCGHSRYL